MRKGTQLFFYDFFRDYIRENIEYYRDPKRQKRLAIEQGVDEVRNAQGISDELLYYEKEVPPALLLLMGNLKRLNPRMISDPILNLVLDMTNKSGQTPVPYVPFPILPFWVEFEGASNVGDGTTNYHAILAARDPICSERIIVEFITMDFQIKSMYLTDGAWKYEQTGTCDSTTCPHAKTTQENVPFIVTKEQCNRGCTCGDAGFYWSQFLFLLLNVLKKKAPILYEEIDRNVPVPQSPSEKKTRKQKDAEAYNRQYPQVIYVSLSQPVRVQQSRPKLPGEPRGEYLGMEKIPVEDYWKVLVPGEGKPWKELHIVHVEEHERAGKPADQRTRYVIEE